MLGETQNPLNVPLLDSRVIEFQLGERQVLLNLVPLSVVSGRVDCAFVDVRLLQALLTPLEVCYALRPDLPEFAYL
jgi:hypothetical protein